MLIILRVILGIIVVIIAGSGLLTNDFTMQPYMMFFLSLMMLVMGLEEFKKERKIYGWVGIIVFLFILFVSLQGFISS